MRYTYTSMRTGTHVLLPGDKEYSHLHQFNLFYRLLRGAASSCLLAFTLGPTNFQTTSRSSSRQRKLSLWSLWSLSSKQPMWPFPGTMSFTEHQPWGVLSWAQAFSQLSVHFRHKSAHWFKSIYTLLVLENQIGSGIVTSVLKGYRKAGPWLGLRDETLSLL